MVRDAPENALKKANKAVHQRIFRRYFLFDAKKTRIKL
jgi:hypothetical protein